MASSVEQIYQVAGEELTGLGFNLIILKLDGNRKMLYMAFFKLAPQAAELLEQNKGIQLTAFEMPYEVGGLFASIAAQIEAKLIDPLDPSLSEIMPAEYLELINQISQTAEIGRVILAPLVHNGDPSGFLCLNGHDLNESDLAAVNTFAKQISVSIEKIELLRTLRANEAYFRALIEHSSDVISILDLEGRITYESPSVEVILGYPSRTMIGTNFLEIIHPQDHARVWQRFEEIIDETPWSTHSLQFRLRHQNGNYRFVEAVGSIFKDRAGEKCVLVNLRDISERVSAEQELAEQRDFLESIYQGVDVAIAILNTSGLGEFRFAGWNIAYENKVHLKVEEGYWKRLKDLTPEPFSAEFVQSFRANLENCLLSEQPLLIEEQLIHKGQPTWWLTRLTPLRDAEGHCYRVISTSVEISERKIMEEELRRAHDELEVRVLERTRELHASEAQLRQAVVAAPFPIMIHAEDGEVLLLNQAWTHFSGYTLSDIPNTRDWLDLAYGEHSEQVFKMIQDLFVSQETVHEGEFKLHTRSGEERIWDFSSAPLGETPDGRRLMISIADDVTGRVASQKQLAHFNEELARSNADLEQFAYVASHDLLEPLRMVNSYLQFLEMDYADCLDEQAQEYISFAVEGAGHMQSLIKGLLDYSRVGTQGVPFEKTSMEDVLQRVLKNLELTVAESGARITHDPLPEVNGDPTQLVQLLQNLIANAIKFRSEKPVEVHVGVHHEADCWQFSVRDNGIGFDVQHAERIFMIFQRLHTQREYAGTGIGLAVCKRIVERHGGKIWAKSQPGQGACFYFTLPDNNE